MGPTFKRNLITNLLIVAVFAVVSILYCYPAIQGKILAAHDNIQWRGISEEARKTFQETHEPVLWSNSIFGGMPSYTFYSGSSKNMVPKILDVIETVLPRPIHFLFIAMLSFFVLGLVLRIDKWAAVVGALAYGFSTFFLVSIAAGHDTKVLAIAYMPMVLAGFFLTFRGKYLAGAALTCVSLALMTATQHIQIMYYLAIILGFAWLVLLFISVREKLLSRFLKATVVSIAAATLAVITCLGSVLITKEYNEYTMRGGQSELSKKHVEGKKTGGLDKEYAMRWSMGKAETATILVADAFGGSSSENMDRFEGTDLYNKYGQQLPKVPTYWGPQPMLSGPVYFGAIICFLFLLGMLIVPSTHKWWMAAASFIAILMSWGYHLAGFNYFLFDHLPLFNVFRTPSMILVIPAFLFPLLGIWALSDIIAGRVADAKLIKSIYIAAGITGGLALLIAIMPGALLGDFAGAADAQYGFPPDFLSGLRDLREGMAMKGGFLSALYIALSAGVLWLYAKKKIAVQYLLPAIGILVLADLVPVAKRYLNPDQFQDEETFMAENFQPRPVDLQIKQDPDPYYRVLDLTRDPFNDGYPAYFHKMVGGYSPAKMEIYQDLISEQMGSGFNAGVMNMLNTKYFIAGKPGQEGIIPNPDALGNAWFVNNIKWVNSADSEMYSMRSPMLGDTVQMPDAWKPGETAIIRNTFKEQLGNVQPGKDSAATVLLTKYGLNQLSFESNNAMEGLAVFSDIWYPKGWKAYVDGKETPIVRANYVLRAIKIPAGKHKIEFKFRPETYETGERIALFASLAVFALLLWAIIASYRDISRKADDTHTGINQG